MVHGGERLTHIVMAHCTPFLKTPCVFMELKGALKGLPRTKLVCVDVSSL